LPYDTTIDDYADITIQYSYVVLFIVAFPLAPVIALASNMLAQRLDAFKLVVQSRRPDPRAAQDLGSWLVILQCINYIAIINNVALLCLGSSLNIISIALDWPGRLIAFFAAEHIVLALSLLIDQLVDDVPSDVQTMLARQQHVVNKYVHHIVEDDEIDEGDNNVGGHSHRPADPVAVEMVPPRFKSLDVSSHDADADDDSRRSIFDVGFSELKEKVQSAGQLLTHRLQSELESKV
jgi:hypothetical protein